MRCPQCDNALVTIVEDLPRAASPRTQRQQGEATGALEQLSSFAQASGTEAARAVLAGRNAQLRTGNAAENCDREEIGRLGHTTLRVNTLERSSATVNGSDAKATGWTPVPSSHRLRNPERHGRRRVRRTRPTRTRSNRGDGPSPSAGIAQILTAQEAHLARLAAQGLTNTGIGEALYLSPRTVEWSWSLTLAAQFRPASPLCTYVAYPVGPVLVALPGALPVLALDGLPHAEARSPDRSPTRTPSRRGRCPRQPGRSSVRLPVGPLARLLIRQSRGTAKHRPVSLTEATREFHGRDQ